MKLFTLLALVASVAAVRVETHTATQLNADDKQMTEEALIHDTELALLGEGWGNPLKKAMNKWL